MSELTPGSRAFLDEVLDEDEPTVDELETRRLAVFANLGLPTTPDPGGGNGPSAPVAEPIASSTGVGFGTKALVATLAIVAASAGVFVLVRSRPQPEAPPQSVATAPAMPRVTTAEPEPVVVPDAPVALPEPTPVARPRVEAAAPRAAGHDERDALEAPIEAPSTTDPVEPETTDSLSEESMLVAAAEAQLRAGHAAEALSLYDRALARHPSGALRLEAVSGRIAALCRSGRLDDGRRELERFVASYPRSPSGPRLRALCGVEP